MVARGELFVGRADLPARQPAARAAVGRVRHQAAAAGPLGHHAGTEFRLRASQPVDQSARPRRHLHLRPRARRAGHGRERLARRHLQRALSGGAARRAGHAAVVPPVQFSRRRTEPCVAGHAGLDARRWRTRLFARTRLRRGARQSRPDRGVRHRRRRGGNGAAGGVVAQQQIPQSRDRRRGAAHSPFERLQDRQSHRARAHPGSGIARPDARLRLSADRRRRRCAGADASRHGGRARRSGRCDRRDPARGARARHHAASVLADDHPAFTEGTDRAEDRGWPAHRGNLARAPGADRHDERSGAHPHSRTVDEKLPARRAVRHRWSSEPGYRRAGARGRAAHERQSANQRRPLAARAASAGARRPLRQGRGTRRQRRGGDARARRLAARHRQGECAVSQLPPVRSG